ncbi:MAG TPA: tRNA lysidine(34) synthetase TilS [Opitutaceae bacterium]|nr:tRNA lysidine(34) synthetase TilS [Opitutaceae bacterium]
MELAENLARFAAAIPRERLHPEVVALLDASCSRGETWLVAFSGGADSLALLLAVCAHWPEQQSRVIAAHFNHALRGEESEGDEAFCRRVCGELRVEFRGGRWSDAPAHASEDQARRTRFAFFEKLALEENASLLLTGHHANDVFETQLMRLARGSGSAGLAAPRPSRPWLNTQVILRPLLALSSAEIRAALRSSNFVWREDSSNATDVFSRNRLRRDVVLPWIQREGDAVLRGAGLTRALLEEDDAALHQWLESFRLDFDADKLDLSSLRGKPRALLRRALRSWKVVGDIDRRAFDELLAIAERGEGQMSLGEGTARMASGKLCFVEAKTAPMDWAPGRLELGGELFLPQGGVLSAKLVAASEAIEGARRVGLGSKNYSVLVCESLPMDVRCWRPGDRYQPLGSKGTTKLQDLFVNRKIAAPLRRQLPIIVRADGRIVWVPGLPPAEQSKVTGDSVTVVQLTYTSGTSTVRNQS